VFACCRHTVVGQMDCFGHAAWEGDVEFAVAVGNHFPASDFQQLPFRKNHKKPGYVVSCGPYLNVRAPEELFAMVPPMKQRLSVGRGGRATPMPELFSVYPAVQLALDGNDCPVCRKDGRFAYGIKFLHGKDEVAEGDSSSCCACAVACYGETAVLPWCVFQKLLDLCNGFRKNTPGV